MTFEEAVNKYLDQHGDFGTAMHFGQAMYEAGKLASRRPYAFALPDGKKWSAWKGDPELPPFAQALDFIHGGFDSREEAKEWARSNGYEVC